MFANCIWYLFNKFRFWNCRKLIIYLRKTFKTFTLHNKKGVKKIELFGSYTTYYRRNELFIFRRNGLVELVLSVYGCIQLLAKYKLELVELVEDVNRLDGIHIHQQHTIVKLVHRLVNTRQRYLVHCTKKNIEFKENWCNNRII